MTMRINRTSWTYHKRNVTVKQQTFLNLPEPIRTKDRNSDQGKPWNNDKKTMSIPAKTPKPDTKPKTNLESPRPAWTPKPIRKSATTRNQPRKTQDKHQRPGGLFVALSLNMIKNNIPRIERPFHILTRTPPKGLRTREGGS